MLVQDMRVALWKKNKLDCMKTNGAKISPQLLALNVMHIKTDVLHNISGILLQLIPQSQFCKRTSGFSAVNKGKFEKAQRKHLSLNPF